MPIGTVPDLIRRLRKAGGRPEDLTWRSTATRSSSSASRAWTISPCTPAWLLRYVPMTARRLTGIALARRTDHGENGAWRNHYRRISPITTLPLHLAIMRAYDVSFSLGDGLRPDSIADANDTKRVVQSCRAQDARRADEEIAWSMTSR